MDVRLTGDRDEVSRALRLIRAVLPVEDVTGFTTSRWSYPDVHLDVRVTVPPSDGVPDPPCGRAARRDEDAQ